MGDRTYVNLYVPADLADQAREIITECYAEPSEESEGVTEALHHFGFEEVNYGNLGGLGELQAAGIAYNSEWDAGGEYGAGTQSCRFTKEGDAVVKTVYDDDIGISTFTLLPHIEYHAKLKELIQAHHEKVNPLSWDDQVENGKTYQLKQLIDPT